ncbi:GGDEF domain-containing protein [bacterium SCSIO 12696]|nr:GGDEF domain-containing protein [bacterium SCSIO 12696]
MSELISSHCRESVLREQVSLLYRSAAGAVVSSAGLMLFTVIALWEVAPAQQLLVWGAAHLVLAIIRLLWLRRFSQHPDSASLQGWINSFLVMVFVNGLLWGLLLSMYSSDWPLPHQFMTWIVYPGVVAGAVMALGAYFPAFVSFVVPLILSCAWALLSIDDSEYGMMLLIMVVFFACVLMTTRRYNATLVEAIEVKMHLQEANRKLTQLATQDVLTGVPNRRAFDYQLEREWGRSKRQQTAISLLMVDVDHFKSFNDRFGHSAGDNCLKEVAVAIAGQLRRPSDLASRFGGEEFALLLPDTDINGAAIVAENILQAVRQVNLPGIQLDGASTITVSIGVSCCTPSDECDALQLMEEADRALYQAKDSGRNCVALSQP